MEAESQSAPPLRAEGKLHSPRAPGVNRNPAMRAAHVVMADYQVAFYGLGKPLPLQAVIRDRVAPPVAAHPENHRDDAHGGGRTDNCSLPPLPHSGPTLNGRLGNF